MGSDNNMLNVTGLCIPIVPYQFQVVVHGNCR